MHTNLGQSGLVAMRAQKVNFALVGKVVLVESSLWELVALCDAEGSWDWWVSKPRDHLSSKDGWILHREAWSSTRVTEAVMLR